MKAVRFLFVGMSLALLAGLAWWLRLPMTDGYHLRHYLWYAAKGGPAECMAPIHDAIRRIGPKGVPYLLSRIRQPIVRSEEWRLGQVGFWVLGDTATSAIPHLELLLQDTNRCIPAALSLACLGAAGLKVLLAEGTNAHPRIAEAILNALSWPRVDLARRLSNSPPALQISLLTELDTRLLVIATNRAMGGSLRLLAIDRLAEAESIHPQSEELAGLVEDAHSTREIRRAALVSLFSLNPEYAERRGILGHFANDPIYRHSVERGLELRAWRQR